VPALVLAVVAGVVTTRHSSTPRSLTRADVDARVKSAVDAAAKQAASAPARSATVYQSILPSMVVVQTDRGAGSDDSSGLGSGVIVSEQGAILTARHVVADARTITVAFADGTSSPARLVSEDASHDIAVLSAAQPPSVIVPAVLGATRGLRVGDEAFAVGHPLGLTDSMSAGVISGLNRSVPVPGGKNLDGLIQFDTAVNPGNSGGPLLNRDGQVIGIVTALANPSEQGFFVGIGFAVPINTAAGGAGSPPR
jgi:S1-C subfamily serine protease